MRRYALAVETYPEGGIVKRWMISTMFLAMVLGLAGTALAQETVEEATPETTAPETTTPPTTEETPPAPAEEAAPTPAPPSPEFTLGADGISVERTDANGVTNIPCFQAFRDEQIELASSGIYPTLASDAARACEEFGIANPYPAPYFYDTDGFLYTYDPIEGIYSSNPDPATGLVYIYSPANGAFYTYDPTTGAYL